MMKPEFYRMIEDRIMGPLFFIILPSIILLTPLPPFCPK